MNDMAMRWSALQSSTKTADKNNGGRALHKDGGRALDLFTITLKTDSSKPMCLGILQQYAPGSNLCRLLPKASGHSFEGYAAKIILSPNEHIAFAVRTCRGSIYRTRNDGRHKCRPYKDLKKKFLFYQVIKLEVTLLYKLDLGNSLFDLDK
jgi:hypothetical protein